MLPTAIPNPLKKLELVMEMSVLLALTERLSSPLYTVQLLNVMWDDRMVSAPSVLAVAKSPVNTSLLSSPCRLTAIHSITSVVDENTVQIYVMTVNDGHGPSDTRVNQ